MSILTFMSNVFKPVAETIDNLHTSPEEMAILRNQLAEVEAKVVIHTMDLQSQLISANAEVAKSEQQYGNTLSKSWRPVTSICFVLLLVLMGVDLVPWNETLAQIAGMFLGVYGVGRSIEKRGKK